jgi:hypothetical protein
MTPDLNRAAAVWRRLVGLFGAEAVTRKFGETPPTEWVAMIARLKDYELERGVRRLTNSGKTYVPSLPEFLKLCREVRNEDLDEPPAPMRQLAGPKSGMDSWDEMANRHFLAYLLGRLHLRLSNPMGREELGPFLAAKRTWALMMREAHALGEIPPDHGRKWWDDFMTNAELCLDEMRKPKAA